MKFSKVSLFFFFLIVSPLLLHSVFGQSEEASNENQNINENTENSNKTDVVVEEVAPKLEPSPFAFTSFVFPSSNNRKFLLGEKIPVVIALHNQGNGIFNVTQIAASLMYPQDHRYFIQNYTKTSYSQKVLPSEQRSFVYTFAPDAMLEPDRDYGLVVSIFYSDAEGGNFTNVIFNNTMQLVEDSTPLDLQSLFTYVFVLGVAGLIGFVVFNAGKNLKKKKGGRKVEYGTQRATVIDNEWLEGTNALKSPGGKRSRSPKPKKN